MLSDDDASVDVETLNSAVSGGGSTPAHLAAENGYLDIVTMLAEAGANVTNATNEEGQTPLHKCAEGGHEDVVAYLLRERGADPDARAPAQAPHAL